MTPEIVGILTVLLAGAVSLLATTLSKEQKISEFRQAWIDGLREDLTRFLSSAQSFSRAIQAHHLNINSERPLRLPPFTDEQIGLMRIAASETCFRIRLRLNFKESAHRELMKLIGDLISDQNRAIEKQLIEIPDRGQRIIEISDLSSAILKAEWSRVKYGEREFRFARHLSLFVILAAVFAMIVMQYYTK